MRSSGVVSEMRTYPSPPLPKNDPGAKDTPHSSSKNDANPSESQPEGTRIQMYRVPCDGEKIGRGCRWLLTAVVDDTMMILAKL
jgi:hypothetical protein